MDMLASEGFLSFMVAVLVFLCLSLLYDFVIGDRGKEGQLKLIYDDLKVETEKKEEITLSVISELHEQNRKKNNALGIITSVMSFIIALLLFKSFFLAVICSVSGIMVPKSRRQGQEQKRMDLISEQFRDALNTIMASLKSGLSMNSAIIKTPDDLAKVHKTYSDKIILNEFLKMKHDLSMGIPLEDVLVAFRDRMQVEEVNDFVSSIIILKKKGGNLVEVMENTCTMIADKMILKSEIKVLTAAKKGEAKILSVLPIGLICLMSLIASKYMEPLFQTWLGNILCIIGFIMLAINYFVGKKITDIQA